VQFGAVKCVAPLAYFICFNLKIAISRIRWAAWF